MKSAVSRTGRHRFWVSLGTNLLACAAWDILKPLLKAILLSSISLFGLATATIHRLLPTKSWLDAMGTGLLITASVMVPAMIMLIGARKPQKRAALSRLAWIQLNGREIRGCAPKMEATETDVDTWLTRVGEWTQETVDLLQRDLSMQAVARFMDDSGLTAGSYSGTHARAQRALHVLHRRLQNISDILDNSGSYC